MVNDEGRIEELKKKLYSIADDAGHSHRSRLHPHASQVARSWSGVDGELDTPVVPIEKAFPEDNKSPILKRILAVSILALISAGIFAWYMFATGGNYVSGDNIDIKVTGPVSIPAGDTLTLDFDVTNNNPEKIEAVDLIIQYPDGTRKAEDGSTVLLSDRLPIGDIDQGKTERRRIQVILFGEENIKKEIKVTAEYKVPGSVVLFHKEKTYPLFIGSAPVTIDITNFKEVVPNQTMSFKAVVTSNSKTVTKNLVFKAEYPAGFSFEKSDPSASFGNNVWTLGDISPGEKREIEIKGKIVGDANVERYFGFIAGTEDPLDHSNIAVKIVETKEKVLIRKPFLAADFSLNKVGSAVYTGTAGQPIRGEIVWQNNLDVPLYDLILEMKVTGQTIDKKTVESGVGFYTSQDNLITWNKSMVDEFKEIVPNQSGTLQFALSTLPPTLQNNSNLRRQSVNLELTVRAKRLTENNVPEEIKSTASKSVKIATGLNLSSRLVRNVGPFENTGPIPPRAEQTTTYTVINSISNSFNNVKDVTYKTTLPSYVTWLDKVYPENSGVNVKYNKDTREVTWSLGDVAPGTGYNSSAKEFSFQVAMTPSISQVGQVPVVINPQRIAGTDVFTETIVESIAPVLGTNIETDPQYKLNWEKVVN